MSESVNSFKNRDNTGKMRSYV